MNRLDEGTEVPGEELLHERRRREPPRLGIEKRNRRGTRCVDAHRGRIRTDVREWQIKRVRGERDAGHPERVRLGEERRGDGVVICRETGLGPAHDLGFALLVHGALDKVCPVSNVDLVVQALGTRDATSVILQRSGHVVTEDCERERAAAALDAFVARLLSGSADQ